MGSALNQCVIELLLGVFLVDVCPAQHVPRYRSNLNDQVPLQDEREASKSLLSRECHHFSFIRRRINHDDFLQR